MSKEFFITSQVQSAQVYVTKPGMSANLLGSTIVTGVAVLMIERAPQLDGVLAWDLQWCLGALQETGNNSVVELRGKIYHGHFSSLPSGVATKDS